MMSTDKNLLPTKRLAQVTGTSGRFVKFETNSDGKTESILDKTKGMWFLGVVI